MLRPIYNLFHNHYHRRYHGFYRHAKQLFVFDMGLLAFTLFLFGLSLWLLLWKPGVSNLVDITISLGTERIRSGENVHLSINYKNNSKVKLVDTALSLRLPNGFVVSPNTAGFITSTNGFELSDLPPGSSGTSDVYGKLWTNIGKQEKIVATLSYKQENTKNTEQSVGVYYVELQESVLGGSLTSTSGAFANSIVPITFTSINNGAEEVSKIFMLVNGTRLSEAVTLATRTSTSTSSTLKMPDRTAPYPLLAEVKVLENGSLFTQVLLRGTVNVVKPDITLRANFDNKLTYADPGSTLSVDITWKNNGTSEFKNQRIRLGLTPGIVDIAATAKENRLERDGDDLIIDQKTRTELANGRSGAGETFTIKLNLLPSYIKKEDGVNELTIKPTFEGEAHAVAGSFIVEGVSDSIRLPAEVAMNAAARYFTDEGDQLGRGPLPPVVGKTTRYWVFANVSNRTNALRGGRFTFSLAPGVTFTGKQSVTIGPELEYNADTRTVSWNYNGPIPADSESGIFFEIGFNPSPTQVGTQPVLVSGVSFESVDAVVGKKFDIALGNIKNVLPGVDLGSRSGTAVLPQ